MLGRRMRRNAVQLRVAAAAALLAAALCAVGVSRAAPARADIADLPAQYVAKLFTEGLGRAPDQKGWNAYTSIFNAEGCTLDSLQHVGKAVLESGELTQRWGTDPYALAEVAYRALLNRELDPAGFPGVVADIRRSGWDRALTHIFGSTEFRSLRAQICSSGASSYGFNDSTGITPAGIAGPEPACTTCLPVATPQGSINPSEAQLRVLASMPNEVIELAPRAVITITQPLTLAPGVVLETYGDPNPAHYIDMARLVRDWNTNPRTVENSTVVLQGGAELRSVWVSGQRALWRNTVTESLDNKTPKYLNVHGQVFNADDVRTIGGFSTAVVNDRLDDSPGWTTLELYGAESGHGCVDNLVVGNLIEAYSSVHIAQTGPDEITPWTDGISDHCQSSIVTMNQIVDASDVPLILFESDSDPFHGVPAQTSQASSNVIVSAGNSAYSALVADPGYNATGPGDTDGTDGSQDFTGSIIGGRGRVPAGSNPTQPGQGNVLWTASRTHFNAVISDGTIDFFGKKIAYVGRGATFLNNTTGIQQANAAAGIVVSGMMDTTVRGNTLRMNLIPGNASPATIWKCIGAEHESEWYFPQRASGDVQDNPWAVETPTSCIVPGT